MKAKKRVLYIKMKRVREHKPSKLYDKATQIPYVKKERSLHHMKRSYDAKIPLNDTSKISQL
jgi:hypothetical protein